MTSCTPPSSFSRSSSLGMFSDSGPTPAIGLIAPPSTWYRPRNVCVRSMLMTSLTSSTTQITPRSRRGSAQIGQGLDSQTLPHTSQNRTLVLTSSIASIRFCDSSSEADSR